jgi:hypothetical protein
MFESNRALLWPYIIFTLGYELPFQKGLTAVYLAQQAALLAGSAQRRWHQSAAPEASNRASGGVSGPDWLTHLPARCALIAVSQAALR